MNTAWTAASEEIYKAQQGAPGSDQANAGAGQQQQPNSGGGENVTDAEYEEVK